MVRQYQYQHFSPHMTVRNGALCAVAAGSTVLFLRVSWKLYKAFSFSLPSRSVPEATAPAGYDHKADVVDIRPWLAQHHPALLPAFDYGTITLLQNKPVATGAHSAATHSSNSAATAITNNSSITTAGNKSTLASPAGAVGGGDDSQLIDSIIAASLGNGDACTSGGSSAQSKSAQLQLQPPLLPTLRTWDDQPKQIWILGTAHVSDTTAEQVKLVIQSLQPDAVVVELCPSRSFIMQQKRVPKPAAAPTSPAVSNAVAITAPSSSASEVASTPPSEQSAGPQTVSAAVGAGSSIAASSPSAAPAATPPKGETMAATAPKSKSSSATPSQPSLTSPTTLLLEAIQSARSGKQPFMPALLSAVYKSLAEQLGTTIGLEFVLAHEAVRELSDAQKHNIPIFLGDVPVNTTIRRCWGVLNLRQKFKLATTMLQSLFFMKIDDKDVESLMSSDIMDALMQELGTEFPPLLGPLLHERNLSLATAVRAAHVMCGAERVVLVCGRAHVPGLVYTFMRGVPQ